MPYIGVSPQFGVRRKHTYTATAGQTSFSGAGSEGATLSYTDSNFVDVYQNGVKLGDADYTSTSGTAIVLAQGASVDDLVEIIVFDAFSAADTVSKADGGTFDGNVTMGGTLGVTGAATLSSTLGVTGASTLTGALSAKGGAVFNEDSADVDFRVEGNGDANLFVVDGGEDNVKIGSNAGNYGILSIRNENAGAQERGMYIELAPASGTSPNNVAVFSATNSNMTQPLVRIHHEDPPADAKLITCTTTGSNTEGFYVDENGDAKATRFIGGQKIESSSGVASDTWRFMGLTSSNSSGNHGAVFASKHTSSYSLLVGQHDSTFQSLVVRGDTRVGIGVNVGTSYHFQVSNLSGSGVVVYFHATSGVGVYLSNGANSWSTASDETLKENIKELDKQKSYDNIKNIRAVNYKYIDDEDDDTKRIGFIAQDWQTKYPETIVADAKDSDKLGLNYTETIPVLLSALQKAQEKIATLETENATKETQIADLISRVTALENAE